MDEKRPRLTAAMLVENEGKILLGLRNKVNAQDHWVIPGGGVEYGETTEEAAIRELKEETNLDVEDVKLIGAKEIIANNPDYHSIIFFYQGKAKHFDIKAQEDLAEVKFFTMDEIKNLTIVDSVKWCLEKAGYWKD